VESRGNREENVRHREILFKAHEYHEGLLDRHERGVNDRHLRACPDCRSLYERWRNVNPPAHFLDGVMSEIPDPSVPIRWENRMLRFQWWGAAAAVLLIGLVFWRPERDWINADRSLAWTNHDSGAVPTGEPKMKGEDHD
jgi:hypothetical protein